MRKWIAVLFSLVMVVSLFSGCLGQSIEGFSTSEMVLPESYQIDRETPSIPDPSSPTHFDYSYSLEIERTKVFLDYGGVLLLTMNNTGENSIFVYRMELSWVNTSVSSWRHTDTIIHSGERSELGMLFFEGPPDEENNLLKIALWLAVSNPAATMWHDYGRSGGHYQLVSIDKPLSVQNYTVDRNPSDYFNRVNERVDFEAVSGIVGDIRTSFPPDRSINQALLAFDWVRDNIEYKRDMGGDYWQSAQETLDRGTGDCEDQAILMSSLLGALGLNARVNIIEEHAFSTLFVSQDGENLDQIKEVVASHYWTNVTVHYLNDSLGYWMVMDTAGYPYAGGLPASSSPTSNSTVDWTFNESDWLDTVDVTGEAENAVEWWPFSNY